MKTFLLVLLLVVGGTLPVQALPLCLGNCGTLGADGDVPASPLGGDYTWVSTHGGIVGLTFAPFPDLQEFSAWRSDPFEARAGTFAQIYLNTVTTDGLGFDFWWVELRDAMDPRALSRPRGLSRFRSTPLGAPTWAPLGPDSGSCFAVGCGTSGWQLRELPVRVSGLYHLDVGVVNGSDSTFDSGVAFAFEPPTIPDGGPGLVLLLTLGLAGVVARGRR